MIMLLMYHMSDDFTMLNDFYVHALPRIKHEPMIRYR